MTRLEHQMDLVVSYIPDEYDLLNALKPVNVVKCRARALAPVEHARVTLAPKPGVEGSDFINASFLHSYKRDATFIVTQHPLQTTIQVSDVKPGRVCARVRMNLLRRGRNEIR